MKTLGTLLIIVGLVALIVTGMDYMEDTKSLKLLGERFTFSKGNISLVIISGLVLISGLFIRTKAK